MPRLDALNGHLACLAHANSSLQGGTRTSRKRLRVSNRAEGTQLAKKLQVTWFTMPAVRFLHVDCHTPDIA